VDTEKKEQERLLRAMNKAGPRKSTAGAASPARPVSWNVHLSGRAVGGAAGKKEQDDAMRVLQDQIKKEEALKVAMTNAAQAEQPFQRKTPPTTPTEAIAVPHNLEDQAEINAFNAFNEQRELERINKWTRGGGKDTEVKKTETHYEKPVPAVLMRQFDVEASAHANVKLSSSGEIKERAKEQVRESEKEHLKEQEHAKEYSAEYHQGVLKFSSNITLAAKALKQENSDALVTACFSVVVSAKLLAELVRDETEITSWAKALEGTTNMLRTMIDSGRSGREHYNEIANSLGQLYLTVVSLD